MQIKYSINFSSLISPFSLHKINFLDERVFLSVTNDYEKKILIKKSYIILTWFYYLSFINLKKKKETAVKIFVLPKRKKIFTLTKAPIAHKTNSKEQYKTSFYGFKVSFKSLITEEEFLNSKKNFSIYSNFILLFITKKNFCGFETNLFFLKTFFFYIKTIDPLFFNLYLLK